ncbi:MAG: hypothetical protein COB79_06265, partial [Zetaproteobacteria bacterium]
PRLEFENAFYHVMNRGRARQLIFHDEEYYLAFVDLLKVVHERFGCIIHAYCLMGNHYHLLIETPGANLSRVMRHINGVYTQIYNRLKKTDGSLFRGRFKSIVVDKDAYILQLSRYIHRNPIDMKQPLVSELQNYQWSSFPAYVNKSKKPDWLTTEFTYEILGHKQKYKAYRRFVNQGVEDEILDMYSGKQIPSVIGESGFKEWIFDKLLINEKAEVKSRIISNTIKVGDVVTAVSKFYQKEVAELLQVVKGPQVKNEARKVAMYLCQEVTSCYLKDIADLFNLKSIGSVSFITHSVRLNKKQDKEFSKRVDKLIKSIVSQMT